jgi:hypothetical protein
MERSVDRLDELNHVLVAKTDEVDWAPGTESFDPMTVLRPPVPSSGSR